MNRRIVTAAYQLDGAGCQTTRVLRPDIHGEIQIFSSSVCTPKRNKKEAFSIYGTREEGASVTDAWTRILSCLLRNFF